ncbi:fasciclin domain-containing protein [uncultured Zobellia sp.]|uniref:fasciclin domain-containing protein n=1 Tax=uncultured Zobellia sp. TaxID=255433 RepID=UPI002593E1C8|nr:fasciclin domain-containing protein [uncultured Zobellia sp.]
MKMGNILIRKKLLFSLLMTLILSVSCTDSEEEITAENTDIILSETENDKINFVLEREDTTIFENALEKVELVDYFGTITRANFFIPNDEAWETCFSLLGDSFNSLDDFDTEEELELLKTILLEHVTKDIGPDGFSSLSEIKDIDSDLVMRDHLKNGPFGLKDATGLIAQFEELPVSIENKSVVHIIDKVLIPQVAVEYFLNNYRESLMGFLMQAKTFKNFNDALNAVSEKEIPSFIKNNSAFTLFLPSSGALADLENEYKEKTTQEKREILANIVGYHFIFGKKITSSNIILQEPYSTYQGETLTFEETDNGLEIIDSQGNNISSILSSSKNIAGGSVYLIDKILLPMELNYY